MKILLSKQQAEISNSNLKDQDNYIEEIKSLKKIISKQSEEIKENSKKITDINILVIEKERIQDLYEEKSNRFEENKENLKNKVLEIEDYKRKIENLELKKNHLEKRIQEFAQFQKEYETNLNSSRKF